MTENLQFKLQAHFLNARRSVSAASDGYGWEVNTEAGPVAVRSLEQAIRVARQQMGEFLRQVDRKPGWGLRVEVAGVAASYGDPDPQATFVPGPAADPDELIARIRDRWKPGDSPIAALENAIEIIRGYAGGGSSLRGRRAA